MRLARLLARIAVFGLRTWLMLGVLLRVTRLRDIWSGWPSVIFYSTPWPVLAAGFAVLALHFYRQGRRRVVMRYALFTGAALFTWVATSWVWTPQLDQRRPSDLRVVLWNVAASEARLPGIVKWLRRQDADIIGLAEADFEEQPMIERWRAAFPEYQVEASGGEMVCLVRGDMLDADKGRLSKGSFFGSRRVRVRGRALTVMQVDIYAGAYQSRRPALTRLADLAHARTGEPLIVLGDFNTPRDSVHLGAIRKQMKHAFESAGRGFAETWPMPLPVHNLDQIWFSSELTALRCKTVWTILSDHQPVVADFVFAEQR